MVSCAPRFAATTGFSPRAQNLIDDYNKSVTRRRIQIRRTANKDGARGTDLRYHLRRLVHGQWWRRNKRQKASCRDHRPRTLRLTLECDVARQEKRGRDRAHEECVRWLRRRDRRTNADKLLNTWMRVKSWQQSILCCLRAASGRCILPQAPDVAKAIAEIKA